MEKNKINRRNALKKIGGTVGAVSIMGTGVTSASDLLDIHIWKHKASDDDEARYDIFNALVNFMDQLVANDAIGNYSISLEDRLLKDEIGEYTGGQCPKGENEWWGKVQDFFDPDDSDSDEINNQCKDGDVHIAVTDQTNQAGARGVAWDNSCPPGMAFVGTKGDYGYTYEHKERYQNAAIQEVGHTLMDKSYITVDVGGTDGDDQHALGTITRKGRSTPMVTFYEREGLNACRNPSPELASKGKCDNTYDWDNVHTKEVTQCTIDVIKKTHDEHGFPG